MNAIRKSETDLEKAQRRFEDVLYPACALVWWKDYGWDEWMIIGIFDAANKVWDECIKVSKDKSVFQILEEETGIEMTLDGEKSYKEVKCLNADTWNGEERSWAEYVLMRQTQKKWVAPMILAAICIALHRDEGWGFECLNDLVGKINQFRREHGDNPKYYIHALNETCGFKWNKECWERRKDGK